MLKMFLPQIYRCRIIWDNSYRVVLLPAILWLGTLGENDDPAADWQRADVPYQS